MLKRPGQGCCLKTLSRGVSGEIPPTCCATIKTPCVATIRVAKHIEVPSIQTSDLLTYGQVYDIPLNRFARSPQHRPTEACSLA